MLGSLFEILYLMVKYWEFETAAKYSPIFFNYSQNMHLQKNQKTRISEPTIDSKEYKNVRKTILLSSSSIDGEEFILY
jgi:hypothetical protein